MMKYRVLIEQDEDGVFVAEFRLFPGAFPKAKQEQRPQKTLKRPSLFTLKA
jgi:predicted RNase H-like HicB family nuclease